MVDIPLKIQGDYADNDYGTLFDTWHAVRVKRASAAKTVRS